MSREIGGVGGDVDRCEIYVGSRVIGLASGLYMGVGEGMKGITHGHLVLG